MTLAEQKIKHMKKVCEEFELTIGKVSITRVGDRNPGITTDVISCGKVYHVTVYLKPDIVDNRFDYRTNSRVIFRGEKGKFNNDWLVVNYLADILRKKLLEDFIYYEEKNNESISEDKD